MSITMDTQVRYTKLLCSKTESILVVGTDFSAGATLRYSYKANEGCSIVAGSDSGDILYSYERAASDSTSELGGGFVVLPTCAKIWVCDTVTLYCDMLTTVSSIVAAASNLESLMDTLTSTDLSSDDIQQVINFYFERSNDDTGWIDIPLLSKYSYGDEYGYLKGRIKSGVLHIKGDVKGITADWAQFAVLPTELMAAVSIVRFAGVYNMRYFCGMVLTGSGGLHACTNGLGTWDSTRAIQVNLASCLV